MKRFAMLLLCLLLVCGVGYAQQEDPYQSLWNLIDGSTATIPLSEALFMHFSSRGAADASTVILHNTTPKAYENLYSGAAELIFVTTPAQEDLDAAKEAGIELEVIPVVKDALVFLNNRQNPVEGLSQTQLRDIYGGKIANWQEVGGEDLEIKAYQRTVRSGSQTLFLKLLMQDSAPMEAPRKLQPASMGGLVDAVSGYENGKEALGYTVYYYVNDMYGGENLRLLAVEGVVPDVNTIASGAYPLGTYYYAVLRKDTPLNSPSRALISFLLTDEGQRLAAAAGYVPLRMLPEEGK